MIDLHCHSTLSDGSLGIEEIIRQAARVGITTLSITDHDTLSGYSRARFLGEKYGVNIVQGVEMSAWDTKRQAKVHILCYLPQKPDRLEMLCLKSREIRREVGNEMIEKVKAQYPITTDSVLRHCKGCESIFKVHIMRALIDYGYALEFYGDLDAKLFHPQNGSCIVNRAYPDVMHVVNLIRASHGVAVMAHPMLYHNMELLEELAAEGKIDGVEVDHYSASPKEREQLRQMAARYDLIVTGGSDFHGLYNQKPSHLGANTTTEEEFARLLARNGQ
ncbi:MAG: PHP domain-containing protein [Ruminococcus sp.]|nr:PHP domain-containing protein [Ruminococcus sp.]